MSVSSPHSVSGRIAAVVAALMMLAALPTRSQPAGASHGIVPVTVTISRFQALQDPDPGLGQGDGDFYAKVQIDGAPGQQSGEVSGNTIEPFWTFTSMIDTDAVGDTIPVTIEVLDADSFLAAPDDVMDIDSADNATDLNLILDLTTGDWTGDVPLNQGWSLGDGDTGESCCSGLFEGGEQARIFFDISTLSTSGDADGDGLLDGWETRGLDADADGTIDVDLPAFGADPNHKDLFLEFDWMTGEEPAQAEIDLMKAAFTAAPVNAGGTNNPDGQPGINLWVDTGSLTDANGIEDGGAAGSCGDGVDNGGGDGIDADDPDCLVADDLGGGNAIAASGISNLNGAFYAAKGVNFDNDRRWVFRYGMSAQPGGFGGGWGEIGGNDFIEYNHDGGTIMHELGHTVNLRHGGNVNANCKANYVSVMNYDQQFGINQNGGGIIIDYSPPRTGTGRGAAPLGSLQENNLNETVLLDATDGSNQFVFTDGNGNKIRNPLNTTQDWNGDGDVTDTGVTANINTNATGGGPAACNNGGTSSTLNGHDDWTVIALNFRPFGDSADGAINPMTEPEMTTAELEELVEQLNTSDISVTKSDSADPAVAGEELTYTLQVNNAGPNPATDIVLTDTLPAGVSYVSDNRSCGHIGGVVTCDLGELLASGSASVQIVVLVDADLVHVAGGPTSITNAASVSKNGPDPDLTDNSVNEMTAVLAVADLDLVDVEPLDAVPEVIIGEDVEVTVRTEVANHGPSTPMDAEVELTATASPGTTVTPTSTTVAVDALASGSNWFVDKTYTLSCLEPSQHSFTFDSEIRPADAQDTDPDLSNNATSVTVDIECVTPVAINIKPGSDPNSIKVVKTTVAVAILTTDAGEYGLPIAVDATTIDPLSVRFGTYEEIWGNVSGASEAHNRGHLTDSRELDETTRDGDTDLVVHFDSADTGLVLGTTEACVKGTWTDTTGTHTFFGCDVVRTR
jgi:uncharacterized repeat protein (TIGR01451 family)